MGTARFQLSDKKRQLLNKMLAEQGQVQLATTIPPRQQSNNLPLSFAQQRLWFLNQFDPNSTVYNMAATIELTGQLNILALTQSLNAIIDRHESLRTCFTTYAGQAIQDVVPTATHALPVIDLSSLTPEAQNQEKQRLIAETGQHIFNLATGPLLYTRLLHLSAHSHMLLFVMHHIVSDGWSITRLTEELMAFYHYYHQAIPHQLVPLSIQYPDFALWQREYLTAERLTKLERYWQQQLDSHLPTITLPFDHPRPPQQTYRGGKHTFTLPPNITTAVSILSQQEKATPFMVLLATFKLLLHRYSHQNEIIVGTPIANRTRTELKSLIGCFVNTLVLRTDFSGNPTFRTLLHRIRDTTLAAYKHQDYPFELLVDLLQPERDLSHTPLFQVMFVLQNTPTTTFALPDLDVTLHEIDNGTTKFDLVLTITESRPLQVKIEYNTDLFKSETIVRLQQHWQNILLATLSNSDQCLTDISLLSTAEYNQLIHHKNPPHNDNLLQQTLHIRFADQVRQRPNTTAIIYEDAKLTYQQLDQQANQLAHALQQRGVKPGDFIGLCLIRSLKLIVSILGILKAGGAYVPLDPNSPPERLRFMLKDSQVRLLIHDDQLPITNTNLITINWSTDDTHIAQQSTQPLPDLVTSRYPAYMIYTSGSTGKPKGVVITHQNVARLFSATQPWYNINHNDVWPLFHSYAFDVSVWEMWGALLHGGRLVIVPYWISRQPDAFYQLIRQEKVTILNQTPSAFRQLIPAVKGTQTTHIRLIIFAGEALNPSIVQPWYNKQGNQAQLINMYGTTETTVHVTYHPLTPTEAQMSQYSNIGIPIPDLQLYLLDPYLHPVPIGVVGEVYIGGAGVSKHGYWQRPALTAQRFIPNPFNNDGSRLYKTGDLARYLSTGELDYLGRLDHQVKIRGFRIELGEIESTIAQHTAIRENTVIVQTRLNGHKRLIAYIVTDQHNDTFINSLRAFLQENLPDYMMPSAFVLLDTFPLTINGKLDRKALPSPPLDTRNKTAATTPTEAQLITLLRQVLQVENIGIHDNFFALGGDSILAIQVVMQAQQIGLDLRTKDLFQHQTVAKLAQAVAVTIPSTAVKLPITGTVPLTPIQHWFFNQNLAQPHHYNQTLLLTTPPDFDSQLLWTVLEQLPAQHDALRLRFSHTEAGWQQYFAPTDETAVHYLKIDLSHLPNPTKTLTTIASQQQEMINIRTGPVLRIIYFQLRQTTRLLFIAHHLIIDGISWRILLQDIQSAYQHLKQQKSYQWLPKTDSYQAWSQALHHFSQSDVVQVTQAYWQKQANTTHPLPLDKPNGRNQFATAHIIKTSLDLATTRALLNHPVPINALLLTALTLTITSWSGQTTLHLNMEGHGRIDLPTPLDISRTLGWFTANYTLHLNATSRDPHTLLKQIRQQLETIPHQGVSDGLLRYLTANAIDKTAPALSFNYLGQFDGTFTDLFQLADEDTGFFTSPQNKRPYLIDINGYTRHKTLCFEWEYSTEQYYTHTIQQLAQQFQQQLSTFATPTNNFPLAELDQAQLNTILAKFNK